jgi:hypothetical protein
MINPAYELVAHGPQEPVPGEEPTPGKDQRRGKPGRGKRPKPDGAGH